MNRNRASRHGLGLALLGLIALPFCCAARASDIPTYRIASRPAPLLRSASTSNPRLPESGRLDAGTLHRRAGPVDAPKSLPFDFTDIDLRGPAAPRSDRTFAGGTRPAPATRVDFGRTFERAIGTADGGDVRLAEKSRPWSEDRLLADATGMNDGYLDLEISPVTGRLYAVFEATDLGGVDRDIHIAWSDDDGLSWQVREMPSFPEDESSPAIAVDAAGFLYVVWIREDGYIVRARSADGDDPENWAWVKGFYTDSINASPAIAVSGSGDFAKVFIAAAYQEINYDFYQWEWTLVWLWSTNGGLSIDFDALPPDGYPDVWPDVAIDGSIVTMINGEADIETGKPRILVSVDGLGGAFADVTDLSAWTAFGCGFPRIAADGQTVVAVYQHDYENGIGGVDGDIIQYVSWDGGATFYGPHEVVADEFESVGPAVYARNGVVGYLWLDAPANADEFDVAGRQGGNNGHPDFFGEVEIVSDRNLAEPQYHYLAGAVGDRKLHAAWIDRRDFMSGGLNVYTCDRDIAPNLTPYTPDGWADVLVANSRSGLRETGYLESLKTAYLSFGLVNNGLGPAIGETRIVLQVNGIPRAEWILAEGLQTATWTAIEDHPLLLRDGEHEIRMTIDYRQAIPETDETDNVASRTWTWIAGEPVVRIEPDRIVHQAGDGSLAQAADIASLLHDPPVRTLKRLPVIGARLRATLDTAAKSGRLPVVFCPARRVDTAAVAALTAGLEDGHRRRIGLDVLRAHSRREYGTLEPLLSDLSRRGGIDAVRPLWLPGMFSAAMSPDAIETLAADPDIGWIWLDDRPSRTFGGPADAATVPASAVPPAGKPAPAEKSALAWHLPHVGADRAWAAGFDGDGVLVGHLDSGVCTDHPDLAGRLWDGGAAWPNHGYDAIDKDDDPYDGDADWRHGTHTAGLIAGDGSDGTSTGVAPGAELMVLRVLPGYWSDLIEGMQFGLDHGPVDLFSMSGGWSDPANDLKNANRLNADVLLDLDIPWIVATGNGDNAGGHNAPPQDISSPADCPDPWYGSAGHSSVIAVGAVSSGNTMWSGSSVGPTVWDIDGSFADYPFPPGLLKPDIAAPGQDVTSTWDNGGYVSYSGTSMACPVAAGAVAILMQASPGATSAELAEALESSAVDIGVPGRDVNAGAGVIDIPAALERLPVQARETFVVFNDGPLPLEIAGLAWTRSWLSVDPASGSVAPGDSLLFRVGFDLSGLDRGTYHDTITLIGNDAKSPHEIDVVLAIDAPSIVGDPAPTPGPAARIRNHPNPFNPMTEIRFETASRGRARLTIHDLRGRCVRTMLDAVVPAGEHALKWNATDDGGRPVAGGVYLLRLVGPGGRVTTGKVSLIR